MYRGFIDQTIKFIEENQLLRPDLWTRFVAQFKAEDADYDNGWRGEFWGKMMRGACFVYSYTRNPKLYQILTDTVSDMLTAAKENGRISTYSTNHEFQAWDIWCRKYVLLGMQYYLEICTDNEFADRITESMCAQLDYIISKIGRTEEGKKPITKATAHWRGLNSSSLLEPVVRLYKLTGEQRYLDFATYIVEQGATDIQNIFELAYADQFYPYQYPVTKAYEMISCFEGLLEYYQVTGIEKHKISIINFANRILESDFTIIGSCGCTHELFDHSTVRQANTTNGPIAQETCVTVTLMKFMYRLMLLTGDGKYADAFETSLYNAYLGAVNTEKVVEPTLPLDHLDWNIEPLPFDSYSPLTAGTRGVRVGGLQVMSDKHYYGCCACIGAAGAGLINKVALLDSDKGFNVNLYIDGETVSCTQSGNYVKYRMITEYPVSGHVKMIVEPETPEEFELRVRIPAWSKNTTIKVNEECVLDTEAVGELPKIRNGYFTIKRLWNTGDTVSLMLDMRTEAIRPIPYGHDILMNHVVWRENYVVSTYDVEDPLAHKHIALRRGPIILAQENRLGYSVDNPVEIAVSDAGYVDVMIPESDIAPYEHIVEVHVPLQDGSFMPVTDYASAGKLWNQESRMAAWMLTK